MNWLSIQVLPCGHIDKNAVLQQHRSSGYVFRYSSFAFQQLLHKCSNIANPIIACCTALPGASVWRWWASVEISIAVHVDFL
jgi:hypothetical protein